MASPQPEGTARHGVTPHPCLIRPIRLPQTTVSQTQNPPHTSVPQDAMIMGADYYESAEQQAAVLAAGGVPIGIGENCHITNAIVDKNSRVGKNVKIINKEGVSEATREAEGIYIRSGIVVINKGTIIKDNTVI